MPYQPVAGDVGGGAHEPQLGQLGADRVDLRHKGNHVFLERARSHPAFDSSRRDARAQRLCQNEHVAGARSGVCGDASHVYEPCDGESVDRFWIANGMAAYDHASDLRCLGEATTQNRRNYSWPNEIHGETDDIEGGQWPPAHGVDVGQRVGGCDLAVRKRVIHDRREKINGLHECAMAVQPIHTRVVERFRTDEYVPVQRNG